MRVFKLKENRSEHGSFVAKLNFYSQNLYLDWIFIKSNIILGKSSNVA